jgi:GT2 family glycosyltransferase
MSKTFLSFANRTPRSDRSCYELAVKEARICLIILNRNTHHTLACLDALSKVCYSKFTKLVIEDGSNLDALKTMRAKHPHVLIDKGTSVNSGIEWALSKPFPWILLLSNEAIVDPDCLSAFMNQAISSTDAKIFGAKILQQQEPTSIAHLGGRWNATTATCEQLTTDGESQIVDYVSSKALLMHRSVPEKIGLLETRYRVSWEDIDFCFRAKRKGFLTRTAPLAKIWHTNISLPHCDLWKKDRLLWIQRNLTSLEGQEILKRVIRPLRRQLFLFRNG